MGGGCLDISGRECRAYSKGTHLLRNCISFDNAKKGFDQNNHPMGAWIENCLSFGNGINFQFWKENTEGTGWVLRNNISMNGARKDQFKGLTLLADDHNSWNLGIKGKPADFVSLSAADAAAPRGADGSLPEHFRTPRGRQRLHRPGCPHRNRPGRRIRPANRSLTTAPPPTWALTNTTNKTNDEKTPVSDSLHRGRQRFGTALGRARSGSRSTIPSA